MSPDALTTLCQAQPAARKLFDWIVQADLEDNRTTVEDLIDHCGISRRNAINLLRALGEAGLGEFKVGRKGHPSRFEWTEDPQQLAEQLEQREDEDDGPAAKAKSNGKRDNGELFEDMLATEPVVTEPPPPSRTRTPVVARDARLIEHYYVLRPNLRIVVALPEDLSAREAEVLGAWINNLSFDR
jgi:hypothetical protein